MTQFESEISKRKVKCPSCGSLHLKNVGPVPRGNFFAGQELEALLLANDLFFCISCNLSFKFPQLCKDELDKLYERGESANWQYSTATRSDWRIAEQWIDTIDGKCTILDIGCFDGQFLSSLNKDVERFGIEVHEEAAQRAESRGIEIVGRDFSRVHELDQSFDIVIATDVIEHVNDPLLFLKEISQITRVGGIMIISTGNAMSLTWRVMGSKYWYCTIAEHLSFISPVFCQKAAAKLGLKMEEVEYFSHFSVSWRVKIGEVLKNCIARVTPAIWRTLRRSGLGGLDCKVHPSLAAYPPAWKSARDHMIVRFKRLPCR